MEQNTKIHWQIYKEKDEKSSQTFSRHKYSTSARKYTDSYLYVNLKAEMSQKEEKGNKGIFSIYRIYWIFNIL